MSEPEQVGTVKSAEIDDEGRVVARLQILNGEIMRDMVAYISVPLSGYVVLSPEAKRQLVLGLPGKPVINRTGIALPNFLRGLQESEMSVSSETLFPEAEEK